MKDFIATARARLLPWFLLGVVAGCEFASATTTTQQPETEAAPPTVARVEVATPVAEPPMVRSVALVAVAEPWETTVLRARVRGLLTELSVDIGSRLYAGQSVATVDAPELAAEKAVLEQKMSQAEAQVETARAEHRIAELTYDRLTEVRGRGDGLVAQHDLDKAEARRDAASGRLEMARAKVSTLSAELDRSQVMIDMLDIKAPDYESVVSERHVNRGALVGPSSGSAGAILTVVRSDGVRIAMNVPEAHVQHVSEDSKIRLETRDGSGTTLEVKPTRLSGALHPKTRSRRMEVDLEGSTVLPGSYLRAQVTSTSQEGSLIIPAAGVRMDEEGQAYALVVEGGRAARRDLTVGISDGERVEVTDGVSAEDQVIVNDPEGLASDMPVEVLSP